MQVGTPDYHFHWQGRMQLKGRVSLDYCLRHVSFKFVLHLSFLILLAKFLRFLEAIYDAREEKEAISCLRFGVEGRADFTRPQRARWSLLRLQSHHPKEQNEAKLPLKIFMGTCSIGNYCPDLVQIAGADQDQCLSRTSTF